MRKTTHVALWAALAITVGATPATAAQQPPPPGLDEEVDLGVNGLNLGAGPGKRTSVYAIMLTNGGPATAENVVVSGTLPSFVKLVHATPDSCKPSGRRFRCSFPTLAAAQDLTIRLTLKAAQKAGPVKRLKVMAKSSSLEANIKDNSSVITSKFMGIR
ncbi:hypothetical protein ACIBG8_46110 [Nonomuraea sp. NPDC050556]|uniref:hypothetical protein n=1 Tax=Nonomuraea sp. NPDC050556 TaxID=3364369 RepID=UPI00378AE2A5